jgi:hypothetical protein
MVAIQAIGGEARRSDMTTKHLTKLDERQPAQVSAVALFHPVWNLLLPHDPDHRARCAGTDKPAM